VPPACEWIAGKPVRRGVVTGKEDVRVWHPGQAWIWQAGGLGVFDPGINALSIVTRLVEHRLFVTRAVLRFPANRQAPIAAELALTDGAGAAIDVVMDFRQTGSEQWDIRLETDAGVLELHREGAGLEIDGAPVATPAGQPYPRLYERFAALVRLRAVDVDLAPLKLVADAFLLGERVTVEPFDE
jgi:D-galactose 1-dehydrogenase